MERFIKTAKQNLFIFPSMLHCWLSMRSYLQNILIFVLNLQLGSYMKNVTATRVLQDHTLKVSVIARHHSTEAQKEDSVTNLNDSQG